MLYNVQYWHIYCKQLGCNLARLSPSGSVYALAHDSAAG